MCHELLRPDFNEFGEQSDLAEFLESLFLSKFPVHQGGGGITESLVCLLDDEFIGVGAIHEGCSNLREGGAVGSSFLDRLSVKMSTAPRRGVYFFETVRFVEAKCVF